VVDAKPWEKERVLGQKAGWALYNLLITFIIIPWISTGLKNPYGYGNSHNCLRSLVVKST